MRRIPMKVVITKPFSLDGESDADYRAPNVVKRLLSLFSNLRPGSDLTKFQLPAIFNFPKSQLQCFGESVYCSGKNLLRPCNNEETSLDRFKSVVAWSISTTRPLSFGIAPYNPILGETHHVSSGSLNVLLEQVSHYPPVSALHATDEKENLEITWCQHAVSKFYGTSVETEVRGKRKLKLLSRGETYEMNSPKLLIRFLPVPAVYWVGNVRIKCQESRLEAELCYGSTSFLSLRGNARSVKGKIYETSTKKTLYEVHGQWDSMVKLKDINNGKVTVIYNGKEVLSGLKTPTVKDLEGVWGTESAAVWSAVSEAILGKDWNRAKAAKKEVEENQRKLIRERESRGETWIPKHFTTTCTKDGDWDCSPIQNSVPSAPITVPFDK